MTVPFNFFLVQPVESHETLLCGHKQMLASFKIFEKISRLMRRNNSIFAFVEKNIKAQSFQNLVIPQSENHANKINLLVKSMIKV